MADIPALKERSRLLKESLLRSQDLTDNMTHILSSFGEASLDATSEMGKRTRPDCLLPSSVGNMLKNMIVDDDELLVHTHKIRKAHENIDKTLKAAEVILGHFDVHRQVESTITGNPGDDVSSYLEAVDKLQNTRKFFTNNQWLRGSNESLHSVEIMLSNAVSKLKEHLKKTLVESSIIIEPAHLLKLLPNVSSCMINHSSSQPGCFSLTNDDHLKANPAKITNDVKSSLEATVIPDFLSPSSISSLHEVARCMISAGYSQECLTVYRNVRSSCLEHMLRKLGVEKFRRGDAQNFAGELVEDKILDWPKHLQVSVLLLLAGERKLCDHIFFQLDPHRICCFVSVVEDIMHTLLNFAEAVSKSKRNPERLFAVLGMYKAMNDVLPEITRMFQGDGALLQQRFRDVLHMLDQTVRDILNDFEQTVSRDGTKIATQDGMIHALTSYVVNYITLLSNYRVVLHDLFDGCECQLDGPKLANKLQEIISALISGLDVKAKQQKDPALIQLFLMNNIQYIVRTIQRSEARFILGGDWFQQLQHKVQLHATSYQHAAWNKVLQCLSMQGLSYDGGANISTTPRGLVKERFKLFNRLLEEQHQHQKQWTVPDGELRKALRVAVIESVVPTYRLFLKNFSGLMESGKTPRKYMKYSAEDVGHLLADLFGGWMEK